MSQQQAYFSWTGSQHPYLDQPTVQTFEHVAIGCYGGNSRAGASKNEDAAFVMTGANAAWTFAAICDAHHSSESAILLNTFFATNSDAIAACMALPTAQAFASVEQLIVGQLTSESFRAACAAVKGETATLICAQKDQFVWWLSIGDNLIYLLHPQLKALGQFALNQRHFYEWVGQVNSLALAVPCYSRGVSELRAGQNHLLLLTDGVLEFAGSPYIDSEVIYNLCMQAERASHEGHEAAIGEMLHAVHTGKGRDSATIIAFSVDAGSYTGAIPSNQ